MFETSTKQELLDGIASVLNPAKAEETIPLPAGTPRAAMSPAQIETAFTNWQEHIMSKNPHDWDAAEKNAIRVASTRILRTL
jgi:hypothetical protein